MGMVAATFRFAGPAPKLEDIQAQVERALGSQLKVELHEYRWDMRGTGIPASVVAPVGGPGPFDIREVRWSSGESFVVLHQTMPSGVLRVKSYLGVDLRAYHLACDAVRSLGGVKYETSPQQKRRLFIGLIAVYAFCAAVLTAAAIVAWYWGTRWAWIVTGTILLGTVVGMFVRTWYYVQRVMRRDAELAAMDTRNTTIGNAKP